MRAIVWGTLWLIGCALAPPAPVRAAASPPPATRPTATPSPTGSPAPSPPPATGPAADFRRLADPALQGAAYVTERERFLARADAAAYLDRAAADEKAGTAARALAAVLRERLRQGDAFRAVEQRLLLSVAYVIKIRALGNNSHAGNHLPNPMYTPLRCVPDEQAYLAYEIEARRLTLFLDSHGRGPGPPKLPELDEAELAGRREYCAATGWGEKTPALGPCLLELALKGWPDENAVATVKKKGAERGNSWGDLYRYMAVHLLGELRYAEATDYLLEVLQDGRADQYLRAHAARALSKIADPKCLVYFVDPNLREPPPKVVAREMKLAPFDAREVVRVTTELWPRTPQPEARRQLLLILSYCVDKNPEAVPAAIQSLEAFLAGEKDAGVRLCLRKRIAVLKGVSTWEDLRHEAGTLEYHDCLPEADRPLLRAAAKGQADPAALAAAQERYLAIIDRIAARYTGSNAFATRELHNKYWPRFLPDPEAQAFFEAAAGLAAGLSQAKAVKALGATEKEICRGDGEYGLGERISRVVVSRRFARKVEGPYGKIETGETVVLIFVDGKLRLIHALE